MESGGTIEGFELWLIVDVQTTSATRARLADGAKYQSMPDTAAPKLGSDGWVEEKCMLASVGRDVDKADEPSAYARRQINEAPGKDRPELAPRMRRP